LKHPYQVTERERERERERGRKMFLVCLEKGTRKSKFRCSQTFLEKDNRSEVSNYEHSFNLVCVSHISYWIIKAVLDPDSYGSGPNAIRQHMGYKNGIPSAAAKSQESLLNIITRTMDF
jgi:hypothetical protein